VNLKSRSFSPFLKETAMSLPPPRFLSSFINAGTLTWLIIALVIGGLAGFLMGVSFCWLLFPFVTACKFGISLGGASAFMAWLGYTFYYAWDRSHPKPPPLQLTSQLIYPNPATDDMTNVVIFPSRQERRSRRASPPSAA
jgi:hypothetical protein